MLYNTLIYPYLQYCNIAWASQQSIHIQHLFILQKNALRIVSKSRWNAHTTPLFRNLSTLKLVDINKLQTGIFMHRAINHQLPSLFTSYFISNTNIHNYFTRQCHNLQYPGLRTNLRKYSIKFFGSYLWNSLPIHLKTIIPTASFKKAYKQYLLSYYIE